MNIIFFGSTTDSVIVATAIHAKFPLTAVVTQPSKPIGRKQEITPTPVELWAKENHIPAVSFANNEQKSWLYTHEEDAVNTLSSFKPDLLISACYGQKIPTETITHAQYGGLNIHPSLLPRWRGADPIPWTILSSDHETGVTIVTLEEKFDQGNIIDQKKIPVTDKDYPDLLRTKLFTMGADLLITLLPDYLSGKHKGKRQKPEDATYARKLTRADGYIPWEYIDAAVKGIDVPREKRVGILTLSTDHITHTITRTLRALTPWPGVWSLFAIHNKGLKIKEEKRIKILAAHNENNTLILDTVQLEGKNPTSWQQFQHAYLS